MNSLNKSPVPLIQGMNTQEVALVFIITVWSDLPTKVLAASINSGQLNLTEDRGWWLGENSIHIIFSDSNRVTLFSWIKHHGQDTPIQFPIAHQAASELRGQGTRAGWGQGPCVSRWWRVSLMFLSWSPRQIQRQTWYFVSLSSNDGAGIFEGILHFTLQPM